MHRIKAAAIGANELALALVSKVSETESGMRIVCVGQDGPQEIDFPTLQGINGDFYKKDLTEILNNPEIDVVFDCRSLAARNPKIAKLLAKTDKPIIDMVAQSMASIVPAMNGEVKSSGIFTLGSYAAQAAVPVIAAVNSVTPVTYTEIVVTTPSRMADTEARLHLDEIMASTNQAACDLGGAQRAKTILLLNPAEPPFPMRATIYCLLEDSSKFDALTEAVSDAVACVQTYVPGYSLRFAPEMDRDRLVVMVEVVGDGKAVQSYAGNLEIVIDAALAFVRMEAGNLVTGKEQNDE